MRQPARAAAAPTVPTKVARRPARTLLVPPDAFADAWDKKPTANVLFGLRLLSELDDQEARAIAAKHVVRVFGQDEGDGLIDPDAATDAYNDTLFEIAVARAICDPNDAEKPHPLFQLAEAQVPEHMTSAGVRLVWDALVKFKAEASPLAREISDAELAGFSAAFRARLATAAPATQRTARKLLGHVADLIGVELEVADAREDVATYTVHGA